VSRDPRPADPLELLLRLRRAMDAKDYATAERLVRLPGTLAGLDAAAGPALRAEAGRLYAAEVAAYRASVEQFRAERAEHQRARDRRLIDAMIQDAAEAAGLAQAAVSAGLLDEIYPGARSAA